MTLILQYLWGATDGLPSIYNYISLGEVSMQLNSVKLSQFYRVWVPYGSHSRAHVKPGIRHISWVIVLNNPLHVALVDDVAENTSEPWPELQAAAYKSQRDKVSSCGLPLAIVEDHAYTAQTRESILTHTVSGETRPPSFSFRVLCIRT